MPPKKSALKSAMKGNKPAAAATAGGGGGQKGSGGGRRATVNEKENDENGDGLHDLLEQDHEIARHREEHILTVRRAFEKAHQSTASHNAQRKVILDLAHKDMELTLEAVEGVIKQVLPLPITSDASQRHTTFLGELSRHYNKEFSSDLLADRTLKTILEYSNAADKGIRLGVCSLLAELVGTLNNQEPGSAGGGGGHQSKKAALNREQLLDAVVAAMTFRAFDKDTKVREKAVACLAYFQASEDVLKQFLVLMCQDPSKDVRRQCVELCKESSSPRNPKTHAETGVTFFPHLIRMTCDTSPVVRKSVWDKLAKYDFVSLSSHWKVHRLNPLAALASRLPGNGVGLDAEASLMVQQSHLACLRTWLHRDLKGDIVAFFGHVLNNYHTLMVDVAMAERLALTLYKDFRTARLRSFVTKNETPDAQALQDVAIGLSFTPEAATAGGGGGENNNSAGGLTPAGVLLWRVYSLVLVTEGYADEQDNLMALSDFGATFKKAQKLWCSLEGNNARETNNLDFVLLQLLKMYEVYLLGGHLTHVDDTTRASLEKDLKMQLSATPETDPSLYVYESMLALKAITVREPHRLVDLVQSVLKSLFAIMKLGATYDDVEEYGKEDARRREQIPFFSKHGYTEADTAAMEQYLRKVKGPEAEQLKQYCTDRIYMLRMQRVVHCYLSEAKRHEHQLPSFCQHVIALGRAQGATDIRVLATYSLGVQCLANAQMVHTFMPLLVKDVQDAFNNQLHPNVGEAALAVISDLIAEYGFKFFASGDIAQNQGAEMDRGDGVNVPNTNLNSRANTLIDYETTNPDGLLVETQGVPGGAAFGGAGAGAQQQQQAPRRLDDCHKFGAHNLLRLLHGCLAAHPHRYSNIKQTAALALCKLLACNRLPNEEVVNAIAHVHIFIAQAESNSEADESSSEHAAQCSAFFTSYAYSLPRRQAYVAEGILQAARITLYKHKSLGPCTQGAKLLDRLATLTDASMVEAVRNVDPSGVLALEVRRNETLQSLNASVANSTNGSEDAMSMPGSQTSAAAEKKKKEKVAKSRDDARLWQELYRCSLHEHLAMELLVDLVILGRAEPDPKPVCQKVILETLNKFHFFKRDEGTIDLLLSHIDAAKNKAQGVDANNGKNNGKKSKASANKMATAGPGTSVDVLLEKLDEFKTRFQAKIQNAILNSSVVTNSSGILNASSASAMNRSTMGFGNDQSVIYDDSAYDAQNITFICPNTFADRVDSRVKMMANFARSLTRWAKEGANTDTDENSGDGGGRYSDLSALNRSSTVKQEEQEDEDDEDEVALVAQRQSGRGKIARSASTGKSSSSSPPNDEEDDDESEEDDDGAPPATRRRL